MTGTSQGYFDYAVAVFAGTVVDVDKLEEDYELTFSVSGYWKGLSVDDAFVTARLSSFDSNLCGYNFEEGKEYLTYATESNSQLSVGGCRGAIPIAEAGDSLSALGAGTITRGVITFHDSDPLDGITTVDAAPQQPDLLLVAIVEAIVSLSVGIAVVIKTSKP